MCLGTFYVNCTNCRGTGQVGCGPCGQTGVVTHAYSTFLTGRVTRSMAFAADRLERVQALLSARASSPKQQIKTVARPRNHRLSMHR